MKFPAIILRALLAVALLGSAPAQNKPTLASRLSKDTEEISRSTVPATVPVRKQIYAIAAAKLSRHVNLQPGAISTSTYRSSGTLIHVHWQDFKFNTLHTATLTEADLLNGVTEAYRIEFRAKAYRTWRSGDVSWSDWRSSRYRTFSSGITVEKIMGKWSTKHDPILKYFSPGPGIPSITKPTDPSDSDLPAGVSRRP